MADEKKELDKEFGPLLEKILAQVKKAEDAMVKDAKEGPYYLTDRQFRNRTPSTKTTKDAVQNSVPVQLRSHLTGRQKEQFNELAALFNPEGPIGENPLAKAGALQATPDTFKSFTTPMDAYGVTYKGQRSRDRMTPDEHNMMKEAGITPETAGGHILIGPEGMANSRKVEGVIPHELSHLAGASEVIARLSDIESGKDVLVNQQYLMENYSKAKTFDEFLKDILPTYAYRKQAAYETAQNLIKQKTQLKNKK